jgi:hypothetical protein
MAVTLDKPLKRELAIGTQPYMLTIAPDGLKLVPKGKRIGIELRWDDMVSGQAALAVALNASVARLARHDRRPDAGPQARTAPAAAEPREAPSARRGRSKSPASGARGPRARGRG